LSIISVLGLQIEQNQPIWICKIKGYIHRYTRTLYKPTNKYKIYILMQLSHAKLENAIQHKIGFLSKTKSFRFWEICIGAYAYEWHDEIPKSKIQDVTDYHP
jgi:hypothetical protein